MGVVYKQTNRKFKAILYLEKSLTLRKEIIGEISLPCAQVLEILGKIYLEGSDYRSCLVKFQDCYNIRKKILNNSRHADLVRISLLLVQLQKTIKEDVVSNNNKKTQEILLNVNEHITNSHILEDESFRNEGNFTMNSDFNKESGKFGLKESLKVPKVNNLTVKQNIPGLNRFSSKKPPSRNETNEIDDENILKRLNFSKPPGKPEMSPLKSSFQLNNNNFPSFSNLSASPNFELTIDKEFMASLSTDQLMKLSRLKGLLKEEGKKNEGFDPNDLIMNSELIKGLNSLQYSSFVNSIKPGIEAFNENVESPPEEENNFGRLTRAKEDISGFLKLNDFN